MKRNLFLFVSIVIGFASTFTFVIVGQRSAAQINQKDFALKPYTDSRAPANYAKAHSPLSTSIERIDGTDGYEVLRLKGTVRAQRDFEELKVVWAIPADVQVLSGSIESTTRLAAGESQSFELLIAPKTNDNRQVFFQAQTTEQQDGDNLGAVAEYNTTKQALIAQQLKENFLKAKQKVRSGELRKIVF